MVVFICLEVGSYLAVLCAHAWLCSQGSLVAGSGDHMEYERLSSDTCCTNAPATKGYFYYPGSLEPLLAYTTTPILLWALT